uniref:Putative ovule protein n=1 Tax=Solanum chacoense TaxID=4108 RepID=A0A0V0GFX6_SOLCH
MVDLGGKGTFLLFILSSLISHLYQDRKEYICHFLYLFIKSGTCLQKKKISLLKLTCIGVH